MARWNLARLVIAGWISFVYCAAAVSALHFYLDQGKERCFLMELARETMVLGKYHGEEWSDASNSYIANSAMAIQFRVKDTVSGHVVANKKGASSGKITFTAAESGEHQLCIFTNATGWFTHTKIRFFLDLITGDSVVESESPRVTEKVDSLNVRIRDLIHRAADVKREQQYQREAEAVFQDFSEVVNSRVMTWSVVQILVLGLTCAWQLRHLSTFFIEKKLV